MKVVPSSHLELKRLQRVEYDVRLANGEFDAFVQPLASAGTLVLLLYLMVPWVKYPRLRFVRFPVFGLIVWISVWIQYNLRSPHKAVDFGIGLLNAWLVYLSAMVMLFTDPQKDSKRIQWGVPDKADMPLTPSANDVGSEKPKADDNSLRHRRSSNGHVAPASEPRSQDKDIIYWQSYPLGSLSARLDWVSDLLANFRGIGFTHEISNIPPLPLEIRHALDSHEPLPLNLSAQPTTSQSGIVRFPSRQALFRSKLPIFVCQYVLVDLIKTLMMHDPHFWGIIPSPSPYALPYGLTHIYRMLLSAAGVHTALNLIFSLSPLTIGLLPPRYFNLRSAPWSHPSTFGSSHTISDQGLAGFWNAFWHQVFRRAFAAPSTWIIQTFGMNRRGVPAKVLQLFIAFAMSGILHAAGSYTQGPATNPLSGPLVFFLLQPVGIAVQISCGSWAKSRWGRPRDWICKTANWAGAFAWMYLTSHLLTDDFARGGIWLFEPVPFSLWRGFGFGVEGEGFWVWGWPAAWWHVGDKWWKCGIAY